MNRSRCSRWSDVRRAGGAIITWHDARSFPRDIYAQHVLNTGNVDPTWPLNGRALCTASGEQSGPQILSDGVGGAIVTWLDSRSGTLDIYAQHVLSTGQTNPGWPLNGRAVCAATGHQLYPQLVSDGAGGAIVTWQDERSGTRDIYAQHVLSTGDVNPTWPLNGRALCVAGGDQSSPQIVSDAVGGAIVTWLDRRSGTFDIYAQNVLSSGEVNPAWPLDGRALSTAGGNQLNPQVVSDGAGGAIVAWDDARSGAYDIYAQHVLSTGEVTATWPLNGRAVCTAVGDQLDPQIVSDGVGGAIVTWPDLRSGRYDIYAQRILGTISISNDLTLSEGNDGKTIFVFTLTLSETSNLPVTVDYQTVDGTAHLATGDYVLASSTLTIPANQVSGQIVVEVNGDVTPEPDESFFVNLTGATNATLTDTQVRGTIQNDDPRDALRIGTAHLSSPGDMVRLSVRHAGPNSLGYVALYLDFDSSRLSYSGIESRIPGKTFFSNLVDGQLLVGWFDPTGGSDPIPQTADTLFVVTFAHIGPFVDSTLVTFDEEQSDLGNANGTPIAGVLYDNGPPGGVVTSTIASAIAAGRAGYYLFDRAVPDVRLTLEPPNSEIVTDGAGNYAFVPYPLGNYTLSASKNTDLGGITSLDVLKVLRHWLRLEPFGNALKATAADVNGDGSVTPSDAVKINSAALGLETLASGDWKFVPPVKSVALDRDRLTENFVAIRMGDVDGDWSPAGSTVVAAFQPAASERGGVGVDAASSIAPTLELPDTGVVVPADTVNIALRVAAFDSVGAISLRITFSEQVLAYAGYTTSVSGLSVNRIGNEIRVEQYDQSGGSHPISMGNGTLLVLRFTAVGNPGDSSPLHFTAASAIGDPRGDRRAGTTFTDGRVRLGSATAVIPAQASQFVLHAARPNPSRSGCEVRYELPKEDRVDLNVHDIQGRVVRRLRHGIQAAGSYSSFFDARDESGNRLPAGIYLINLATGFGTKTTRVVLLP